MADVKQLPTCSYNKILQPLLVDTSSFFHLTEQHILSGFHTGFCVGGKQDDSRVIVARESTLTHTYGCVPTRGVWGHAPLEKF